MENKKQILMFYGEECPFCQKCLKDLQENGDPFSEEVEITRLEVWHNEENAKKREEYEEAVKNAAENFDGNPRMTLVPCFVDTENNTALCNPSYEELKDWIRRNKD